MTITDSMMTWIDYLSNLPLHYYVIYVIINCAPMWVFMYKCKHLKPDPVRDAKYAPFVRVDYDDWNFVSIGLKNLFFWPRQIVGWIAMTIICFFVFLTLLGAPKDQALTGLRFKIFSFNLYVGCHVIAFISGVLKVKVEDVDYDYSEYLGTDWKPDKSLKPSTLVGNHIGWMDCFTTNFIWDGGCPAVVTKESNFDIPGLKSMAYASGAVAMKRGDTKEAKAQTIQKIIERQKMAEEGKSSPIYMFPEGASTNGYGGLLKFKKGAFCGLLSVQPIVNTLWSLQYNAYGGDAMPVYYQIFFAQSCIVVTMNIKRLPVFVPNEYFWEHHLKGREKWDAYAETIREIIAKSGDFKLSDCSFEDKAEYKKIMKLVKQGKYRPEAA